MSRNWLSNRIAAFRRPLPRKEDRRNRLVLCLESLEDRTVPTASLTLNWNGGTSTDWFTAANWTDANNPSNHVVPGAADTAVIFGAPNETRVNSPTSVGNVMVSAPTSGFLVVNANLTVLGNFSISGAFAQLTGGNTLTVDGNFSISGGTPGFISSAGTIALAGSGVQNMTLSAAANMPALSITNAAGVISNGGNIASLSLSSAASLTVASGSILNVAGSCTDNGKVFLTQPTPGGSTAPLTVGGTLTLSGTSAFDFTVGSPASGNLYHFVKYGTLVDNSGATYAVHGNSGFGTAINKTPPFISVTILSATFNWNGSVSTDWFTAANWTDAKDSTHHAVPGTGDTAVILGAPNETRVNSATSVGNVMVSAPTSGFLVVNANLIVLGNFAISGAFAQITTSNTLTVIGNFSVSGGTSAFIATTGTISLAGTAPQSLSAPANASLPAVSITNSAGVTVTGSVKVASLSLSSNASLTVASGAVLNVTGSFTDNGTVSLTVSAPGNATAPLNVGGALTLSGTSAFNFAVGSPASGATYLFLTFGSLTDPGVVPTVTGNGGFTPTVNKLANSWTVSLT